MRSLNLFFIWIFGLLVVPGLATQANTPVEGSDSSQTSKEAPRDLGLHCDNAPNTVAGSLYIPKRRSLKSRILTSRTTDNSLTTWCISNTPAYVRIQIIQGLYHAAATTLVAEAWGVVQTTIEQLHDGVIKPGGFRWGDRAGMYVTIWNMNGSKMTWSEVGQTLAALYNMFISRGGGTARFFIYVGTNQVGGGLIANGPSAGGAPRKRDDLSSFSKNASEEISEY